MDDPHDEIYTYNKQQYYCATCGEEHETCRCDRALPAGTAATIVIILSVGAVAAIGVWWL